MEAKTVIDWSKAPEWATGVGTLSSYKFWMNDDSYEAFDGNKRIFFTNYDSTDYGCFVPIAIKPKPESIPVFSQAMCDAGELPSVGMECFYLDSTTNNYIECTVMYISEWAIVLRQTGEGYGKDVELAKHVSDVTIKPLTPPIELVDGKAYQFDYNGRTELVGIYHKPDDTFGQYTVTSNAKAATNIQLLEVKS